jgi:hypothetical protein
MAGGGPDGHGKADQGTPGGAASEKATSQKSRSWAKVLGAVLGAFGILGGIGAYYLPGILSAGGRLVDKQPSLEYTAALLMEAPNFVFPRSLRPSAVPMSILRESNNDPASAESDFGAWAQRHGGLIVDPEVQITLRAPSAQPVIVTSITVRVLRRFPARPGWFNAWYGCGGVFNVRTEQVNLAADPIKTEWRGRSGVLKIPPVLRVTDTDNEVIDVEVYTAKPQVDDWVIDVTYLADGHEGSLRVDNNGRPFVVTSLLGSIAYSDRGPLRLLRDPSVDPGKRYNPDGAATC